MKALTLLLVVSLAVNSWGAVYYVATNQSGASDSNPGTAASPWKTIGKAANTVGAGDSVLVKAGTYAEQVGVFLPHVGTAGNLITFKAYPGDRVIIDGGGSRSFGFRLGASYIRVEGFEIVNATGHGILIGWSDGSSLGVEILNNTIHDCGTDPNAAAVYYSGGDQGLIQGNTLYDNSGDGIAMVGSDNIVIRNNNIHHNGVDGMKGGGAGTVLIEGNIINNQTSGTHHGDGIQAMGMTGTLIIRNNVWWDNTQNIYMDTYGGPTPGTSPWGDVYIYNNIVSNSQADGGVEGFYNGISLDNRWNTINSVTICQNTIVDCNNGSGAGGANSVDNPAIGTLRVFNNLYYNSITGYTPASATTVQIDYNVYYNPVRMGGVGGWYMAGWITLPEYQSTYPGLEQHSVYAPVSFADYSYPNPDCRPLTGSGNIDQGTSLASLAGIDFAVDYNGTVRPQNGQWDPGAFEYKANSINRRGFNIIAGSRSRLALPNPLAAGRPAGSLAVKKDLKIYDMAGNRREGRSINGGVYLIREGHTKGMQKVTILK